MADAATLKSLSLANVQVTASDQWTFGLTSINRTTTANIGGTLSREIRPSFSIATGPIRKPTDRKVLDTILNTTGWELVAELYDGTTYTMSDCGVEGEPSLETDGGVITLEISGIAQQL